MAHRLGGASGLGRAFDVKCQPLSAVVVAVAVDVAAKCVCGSRIRRKCA